MRTQPTDFYQRTKSARKIIVVDFGFLGDSIHLIPALREIKRHYPEAKLHTLSATVGAEVLKLVPCVDQAWAFPLTPDSPPWWRHWGILSALRREHFDLVFNFSGADRTIFVAALLGARWTLARQGRRKHFWANWLPVDWVEQEATGPVYEQRRQLLTRAGFALESARFEFRVPADAAQWAEQAVIGAPIHFSISASSGVKEWPLENWIELARLLTRANPELRIVATSGSNPREQRRLRELGQAAGGRVECFERLSIPRLTALLRRCGLQIGGDSGVLHLAMALGVPTLAILRRYHDMADWMPVGPNHRHLIAPCACIDENKSDCLAARRSACLATITPDAVGAAACQLLQ
jgi:ADP-heptose:LPS heptosyltransferase